jgi:hypothetical protein
MITIWTTNATVTLIRAQQVIRREGRQRAPAVGEDRLQVLDLVGPWGEKRPEDPGEQEARDEEEADDRELVPEQAACGLTPRPDGRLGLGDLSRDDGRVRCQVAAS